ncbi:MAG: HAD family hydrolase, partial [Coriobacteriales bacterium]|nr:HAD family hydrolase [Coriobacteriales bacterium]
MAGGGVAGAGDGDDAAGTSGAGEAGGTAGAGDDVVGVAEASNGDDAAGTSEATGTGADNSVAGTFLLSSPEAMRAFSTLTHIYSDLDGTLFAPGGRLLANHAGEPSTALAEALVRLKTAGIEVIIVTGRNGVQGTEMLRMLNLETFIGEMGTLVLEGAGPLMKKRYLLGEWDTAVTEEITPHKMIIQSGIVERLIAAFPGKLEPHGLINSGNIDVSVVFRGFVDIQKA